MISPAKTRRLTPRSSGAPTAGRQTLADSATYIFTGLELATGHCRKFSSNYKGFPIVVKQKSIVVESRSD